MTKIGIQMVDLEQFFKMILFYDIKINCLMKLELFQNGHCLDTGFPQLLVNQTKDFSMTFQDQTRCFKAIFGKFHNAENIFLKWRKLSNNYSEKHIPLKWFSHFGRN